MSTADQRYDEAIALQQAGKLDEAVAKLEALASDEPDFVLAHAALSVFYSKQGRHDEAVRHAKRVCELDPDDPFSYMALSITCHKAGRLSEAEEAMALAIDKQWEARRKSAGG